MNNQVLVWRGDNNNGQISQIGKGPFTGYLSNIGAVSLVGSVSNIGSIQLSKVGHSDLVVWVWDFDIVGVVK